MRESKVNTSVVAQGPGFTIFGDPATENKNPCQKADDLAKKAEALAKARAPKPKVDKEKEALKKEVEALKKKFGEPTKTPEEIVASAQKKEEQENNINKMKLLGNFQKLLDENGGLAELKMFVEKNGLKASYMQRHGRQVFVDNVLVELGA